MASDPTGAGPPPGSRDARERHPLAGTGDVTGRVVTRLAPDGYVLVDGLLVRAARAAGQAEAGVEVGDVVTLQASDDSRVLIARGSDRR
jgi:hypothetical protein